MNFFEKIDNYENCSEIKALELRTDQVKKLIEEQQSTVKTIEKAQLTDKNTKFKSSHLSKSVKTRNFSIY